jgi:hypothetical protein
VRGVIGKMVKSQHIIRPFVKVGLGGATIGIDWAMRGRVYMTFQNVVFQKGERGNNVP